MSRIPWNVPRLAAAGLFGCAAPARAFLGIADTSLVTVIANPAEAANWAAELEKLNGQLAAATGTLQAVGDLRAYAGNPAAAVGALRSLGEITGAAGELSSEAQTGADLSRAWQALGEAQRLADAESLLLGSGSGTAMQVFGDGLPRDPSLYARDAARAGAAGQVRGQIAQEQAARAAVTAELSLAWAQLRAAGTESAKQAVLAEISQLQSENQVLDARRRAMLDDLALADRQDRVAAAVRSKAADEQLLTESSLLNASAGGRAQGAQAQRMETLQKPPPEPTPHDYSGLRLWTTADAGETQQ